MADPVKFRRDALSMHAYADSVIDRCDHACRCQHHPVACWRCTKVAETYRGIALDFTTRALRAEAEVS
jgi:hypothetical protein